MRVQANAAGGMQTHRECEIIHKKQKGHDWFHQFNKVRGEINWRTFDVILK